jgi:DNA-binding GntR family transcriptional regulator
VRKQWDKVAEQIVRYISERRLGEGAPLPSDRKLAQELSCSISLLMRAMAELVKKGMVVRRAGAATRVITQPPLADDHELSFRYSATETFGSRLRNEIVEVRLRPPHPDVPHEQGARKALGLGHGEAMIVIARRRVLEDTPRALHRAYLNPAHFPPTFLSDHDFDKESLIELYNAEGYQIVGRNTTLRARYASAEEQASLRIGRDPVLDAEQELLALRIGSGKAAAPPGAAGAQDAVLTIEYMQACYVNWDYHVANRRYA